MTLFRKTHGLVSQTESAHQSKQEADAAAKEATAKPFDAKREELCVALLQRLVKVYEQTSPTIRHGVYSGWNPGPYVRVCTPGRDLIYEIHPETNRALPYQKDYCLLEVATSTSRYNFDQVSKFCLESTGKPNYLKALYNLILLGNKVSPKDRQVLDTLMKIPTTKNVNDFGDLLWPDYEMAAFSHLDKILAKVK